MHASVKSIISLQIFWLQRLILCVHKNAHCRVNIVKAKFQVESAVIVHSLLNLHLSGRGQYSSWVDDCYSHFCLWLHYVHVYGGNYYWSGSYSCSDFLVIAWTDTAQKLSFLRLIIYWIIIFPCNSIVRNVRNSKFYEMYMELCKELSPFIGISVTEIYECAYLQ